MIETWFRTDGQWHLQDASQPDCVSVCGRAKCKVPAEQVQVETPHSKYEGMCKHCLKKSE